MTAVITASPWNAIHPDYKTGSPTDGSASILRLTTDRGTVLAPGEIVDRRRLFAFGPLVATPGALRALVADGADPARLLSRHGTGDWGALSADDHDANDEPSATGSASSARTRSDSPPFGSSPTPRPTALSARQACAPATPPLCCCPPSTEPTKPDRSGRHRRTTRTRAGCNIDSACPPRSPLPSRKWASSCPFHRPRRTCTTHSTPVHQRVPSASGRSSSPLSSKRLGGKRS